MAERFAEDSVDMVFTSPPYNVDIGSQGTRTRDDVDYEDTMDEGEYREFMQDVFTELVRVVKPTGHIFINHQNSYQGGDLTPPRWIDDMMPVPLRSLVVWNKGNPPGLQVLNEKGMYLASWEPIYHFSEEPGELQDDEFSVWDVPPVTGSERSDAGDHPAPYPRELVSKAINTATTQGDTILDPFMGSGTTAVAAIQNDRDYVGFELDEEGAYKPIIERRIGEAKRQREASVNAEEGAADD
jgi:DNA modification methylase